MCKTCTFSATPRGDLLTYYRLQHRTFETGNLVPCLVHDCPCSFRTLSALHTHLSRYHPDDEARRADVVHCFTCLICSAKHSTSNKYFLHLGNHLRRHENVQCVFAKCSFKANVYLPFFSHKCREHRSYTLKDFRPDVISNHQSLPAEIHHVDDSGCEDTVSSPPPGISNDIQQRIGLLLLKMENVHNVSGGASFYTCNIRGPAGLC